MSLTLGTFANDVSRYFGNRIDPLVIAADDELPTDANLPSLTSFVNSSDDIRLSIFDFATSFCPDEFGINTFICGLVCFTSPFLAWTVVTTVGSVTVFGFGFCTLSIICLPKSVTIMRRPHAYADCKKVFVSSAVISSPSICNDGAVSN